MSEDRSIEDVKKLLHVAKLDATQLVSPTQSLYFGGHFSGDDVALFELDPAAFTALKAGQRLTIKGRSNDSAVLCSQEKTFELKESETSNSLLLIKNNIVILNSSRSDDDDTEQHVIREVECLKRNYYELKPTQPRLKRLREILEDNQYDGTDDGNIKKLTFEELLNEVQCSKKELLDCLDVSNACFIKGQWRSIEFDYLCVLFQNLLAVINEAGWPYTEIPLNQLSSSLNEMYCSDLASHLLKLFTTILPDSSSTTDFCKLNEENVCRLYAEMILKNTDRCNLEDFKEAWQMSVPDGLQTDFSQIKNLAIVDRDSKPESIRYFPASRLPEDVDLRFQALFKFQEKWSMENIAPYLQDLCSGPQSIGNLLMKHTRMSTLKGVKVYSSKKA